jgi:hypothetical protein
MPEGGFPIRKSPDQSSFATPRSLSQRTTSFIASQCQGIHRMPLRRLIALIINALHPPPPKETAGDHTTDKTILLRIHPMPARCTPRDPAPSPPRRDGRNPAHNRMNVLFTMSNNPQPEHDRANARAATPPQNPNRTDDATPHAAGKPEWPANPNGGARRDRTDDLMLAKHALSQLSYGPREDAPRQRIGPAKNRPGSQMVGLGRLELPTSRLSSARSNQLSYKPGTAPDPGQHRPAKRHAPRRTPPGQTPGPRTARRLSEKKEKRRRRSPANELRGAPNVLSDPKVEIRDRLSPKQDPVRDHP